MLHFKTKKLSKCLGKFFYSFHIPEPVNKFINYFYSYDHSLTLLPCLTWDTSRETNSLFWPPPSSSRPLPKLSLSELTHPPSPRSTFLRLLIAPLGAAWSSPSYLSAPLIKIYEISVFRDKSVEISWLYWVSLDSFPALILFLDSNIAKRLQKSTQVFKLACNIDSDTSISRSITTKYHLLPPILDQITSNMTKF